MKEDHLPNSGWLRKHSTPSLSEAHRSIEIPHGGSWFRKLFAFAGPGLMVAVGYMDPGNWATDLAAGARFGYALLSVVLISNCIAMLLQHLSLKLGIVAERDLAQACRDHYSRPVSFFLWVICEIAIAACDLAEVIGSAIALQLLFHIPLPIGILITALDVFVILYLQERGFRRIEAVVAALIFVIGGCFLYEIIVSRPEIAPLMAGFIPHADLISNPAMLYIAIGVLGATVMPHNLYLHSSIIQTRNYRRDDVGKKEAIHFATIDSNLSLGLAFFVNAAILILSAAVFHGTEHAGISDISDAHKLLSPVVGSPWASTLFAVALLASGQNSTVTGTMAGQIVMEGFLDLRLKPWLRRLITRGIAIVPALIVAIYYGERGIGKLLVFSQVILSLQLSFAVFPLLKFTSSKNKMGRFANTPLLKWSTYLCGFVIAGLNLYLVMQVMGS
ncbi:MAG: Nramp family divalent metal transporter [Bdellovibrionota bacterium]